MQRIGAHASDNPVRGKGETSSPRAKLERYLQRIAESSRALRDNEVGTMINWDQKLRTGPSRFLRERGGQSMRLCNHPPVVNFISDRTTGRFLLMLERRYLAGALP